MHPNQATFEKLYNAFARLDFYTMATCYASDAALAAVNLKKFMASGKAQL